MYLKKISYLFITFFYMTSAQCADVMIKINGTVSANTCSVAINSTDKYVKLGSWGAKQFSSIGTTTLPVEFTIDLENCNGSTSGVTGVSTEFKGNSLIENMNAFSLNSLSSAKNLGILILDKEKKIIIPNTLSTMYTLDKNSSTASLVFYGQYISIANNVTPGSANADIIFSLTYN